jgi:excinuclease ABC subunit A
MRLVDMGNTMVVIEHNLDIIKSADHIIDLGPEGGPGGGQIIAAGTVEDVAKNKQSSTGAFLKKILYDQHHRAAAQGTTVQASQI